MSKLDPETYKMLCEVITRYDIKVTLTEEGEFKGPPEEWGKIVGGLRMHGKPLPQLDEIVRFLARRAAEEDFQQALNQQDEEDER